MLDREITIYGRLKDEYKVALIEHAEKYPNTYGVTLKRLKNIAYVSDLRYLDFAHLNTLGLGMVESIYKMIK